MFRSKPGFHRRLRRLKWLIPLALVGTVIFYELGPSRWIFNSWGFSRHLLVEILLFGTIGPLMAFLVMEMLDRWIGERETVDLQAKLLNNARQKEAAVRQVTDDTIQVLFATNLLLSAFRADGKDLPPNTITQIEVTEKSLDDAIRRLRRQLTD